MHHIIARDLCPSGGYVVENGISVCPGCHIAVEEASPADPELGPAALYALIGTTHARAFRAMGWLAYDELTEDECAIDSKICQLRPRSKLVQVQLNSVDVRVVKALLNFRMQRV